jgi:hypothetical protein
MSPTALATREIADPAPPETPIQKRDRLRQQVRARGVDPLQFETTDGDCNN